MPPEPAPHFGDRLATAVAARESQIVLGLDPDPARLWPAAAAGTSLSPATATPTAATAPETTTAGAATPLPLDPPATPRERAAAAVAAHCRAAIDAAGPACVAVKPQLACFERLGAPGWAALEAVVAHGRAAGLLVLLDAKRGDVPVTAAAYAQALLTAVPTPEGDLRGLEGDAVTANPLLGRDAVEPLVDAARTRAAGVFLLVRTSNPGAADLMDLDLAGGGRVWERLAALADALGDPGPDSGLNDVGAVTGATEPEHLARMRELMPHTPFLLPGVGAQGGDVAALGPAFAPGRAGGLVTASRSIVNAHEQAGGDPGTAARAEAERLRELAWGLA